MTEPDENLTERYAWLAAVVLLGVLLFQLPGTLAERDTDRAFARTLLDVHRVVAGNYVDDVDDDKLSGAGVAGMLESLDPYTVYVPPQQTEAFNDALGQTFHGVGIRFLPRDDGVLEVLTPIENSPAWRGGVLPGDVILRVDGQPIAGQKLEEVTARIKGPEGTSVMIGVRHATGVEQEITLTRSLIGLPMVKGIARRPDQIWNYWADEPGRIGYVRLDQFTDATSDQIEAVCRTLVDQGMKGLILDLRNNPGGRLDQATKIVDLFISEGVIVSTRGRHRPEQQVLAQAEGTLPDFPMVVLINEDSASAAEVTAGALQDHRRATVVGARSYGKGSVQDVIDLGPDRGVMKITVAHYYLPSGRLVQKTEGATTWGVEPDVIVPMDEPQRVRLARAQILAELMYVAPLIPTTVPSTLPASAASTQPYDPIDPQLDKALETLRTLVVLKEKPE